MAAAQGVDRNTLFSVLAAAVLSGGGAYVAASIGYNRELAELQERTSDMKTRVERIEAGFLQFRRDVSELMNSKAADGQPLPPSLRPDWVIPQSGADPKKWVGVPDDPESLSPLERMKAGGHESL